MADAPSLHGARVSLRPLSASDEPLYLQLYGDPDTMARIMPALEPDRARQAFHRECRGPVAQAMRRHTWVLVERRSGDALGLLGLVPDDLAGAEVGVVLPAPHQGRGYATEAIDLAARHAFETLGLDCLHTRHARGHGPAAGLMRTLGFRPAPEGPPPHPVRWRLTRDDWRQAGRDNPGLFR